MSEGLTPDRRAEIEDYIVNGDPDHQTGYDIAKELLSEIDRLNKVVDQAIECELVNPPSTKYHPELAAELQRSPVARVTHPLQEVNIDNQ